MVDPLAMPSDRRKRDLTSPIETAGGVVRVRATWSRGERPGPAYYFRAVRYAEGREIKVASGWMTRRALEEAVRAAMAAPETPRPASWAAETVGELLAWYVQEHGRRRDLTPRTKDLVHRHCSYLLGHLDGVPLLELRDRHAARVQQAMLAQGYAESTVNVYIGTLQAACRAGMAEGWLAKVPKVKRLKGRRKVSDYTPTRAEVGSLIDHLTGWRRVFFAFQAYTGMRMGEVAQLTWGDLHRWPEPRGMVAGVIRMAEGKTGAREIPLRVELAAVLDAWQGRDNGPKTQPEPREHVKAWVRLHHKGLSTAEIASQCGAHYDKVRNAVVRWAEVWPHQGLRRPAARVLGVSRNTVKSVNVDLKAACDELEIPHFTTHGLRRSMADTLAMEGWDVAAVAAFLGMSPQTLWRYYRKATPAQLAALAAGADLSGERSRQVAIGGKVVPFKR